LIASQDRGPVIGRLDIRHGDEAVDLACGIPD
jgi:hypothetical protein